jgi:glycosyltransferase involved in cell wall biosynthesis
VFPAIWSPAFDTVDEIWVPSRFIADSLTSATIKPVKIMPHTVCGATIEKREARRALKIPQDVFVFLTVFDPNSYVSRKNPQAVILAFQDAFPQSRGENPLLIVKYHHTLGRADMIHQIERLASRDDRIVLLNRVFTESEMAALTCAADAFVSLHRSEGFGFNIAEAMASGRLAIATNFSGNTDFMNAENSLLVPYTMRAVGSDYLYGTGQWWADPDHSAAVEAMRLAVHNNAMRIRLAERAHDDFKTKFSPLAVGRKLASALAIA